MQAWDSLFSPLTQPQEIWLLHLNQTENLLQSFWYRTTSKLQAESTPLLHLRVKSRQKKSLGWQHLRLTHLPYWGHFRNLSSLLGAAAHYQVNIKTFLRPAVVPHRMSPWTSPSFPPRRVPVTSLTCGQGRGLLLSGWAMCSWQAVEACWGQVRRETQPHAYHQLLSEARSRVSAALAAHRNSKYISSASR